MRPNVQHSYLRLVLIWGLCLSKFGVNAAVNITVDDADSSISYQPAQFWTLNSQSCKACLHPDLSLAYNQTYHLGTHVISTDDDDFVSSSSSSVSPTSQTQASTHAAPPPAATSPAATPPAATSPAAAPSTPTATGNNGGDEDDEVDKDDGDKDDDDKDDDDDDHHGRDGDDGKGSKGGKGKDRRSTKRLDADDPGFIDSVITAQFKFTGTAVYLYAIEPLFQSTTPLSPTAMNLTFTLDNAGMGQFFHNESSSSASDFASNVLVFSQADLENKPHVLLVTVQPETTFIFDYMVYTSTDQTLASLTPNMPSPTGSAAPSSASKQNVPTFVGAIAGTAGALFLLALGTFLSIWRRRILAAKRERRERRLEDPEGANSTPRMIGPQPFVPRYFPGTVLPPSYEVQRTPYVYSDPEDIDAYSTTVSEESSPSTAVSTAPLMTRTGIPILTIPSAPPPVYHPSPATSETRSSSATSTTSGSRVVPITFADIPPTVAPPSADQLDVSVIVEPVDVLPSFGEALSSPIVPPASLLPLPGHEDGPVSTVTPNTAPSEPIPETTANDNTDAIHEPENDTPTSSSPLPTSDLTPIPTPVRTQSDPSEEETQPQTEPRTENQR